MISKTENGRTKNYTYDANSNVTDFTLNNGDTQEQSITYGYDSLNRLTNITADGKIFSYTYDAVGNLTQKSAENITTNYSYNSANMITALENLSGAQTLNRYTYGYSVDGNRISDVEEGGISKSYSYDGLGRLINETQTQDGVSAGYTYGYDPNGNLIAEWNSVTAPKSGAEPTLSIGVVGKDSTGTKLYEYDSRNRLVKAMGDFGTAEYAYNVNGLRKSKTVNGTTTGFIWNGMNMIAETSGNAISANYAYDITGIAMSKQNGAYQYYLKNAHGDVTGLSNGSGTLIQSYVYDAFGNQLNADDTDANPFRYAGEYYDTETGSIYLRNRYYSPTIGRFITEDPIKDGFNWYAYANNNPIMFFDPTGEYYISKGRNGKYILNKENIFTVAAGTAISFVPLSDLINGGAEKMFGVVGGNSQSKLDVVDMLGNQALSEAVEAVNGVAGIIYSVVDAYLVLSNRADKAILDSIMERLMVSNDVPTVSNNYEYLENIANASYSFIDSFSAYFCNGLDHNIFGGKTQYEIDMQLHTSKNPIKDIQKYRNKLIAAYIWQGNSRIIAEGKANYFLTGIEDYEKRLDAINKAYLSVLSEAV